MHAMKYFVLICALLLTATDAIVQEKILRTTPIVDSDNDLSTARVILDEEHSRIEIQLRGTFGKPNRCAYTPTTNPTGRFLLDGLNKANLSSAYNNNANSGSLKQRIYHRLVIMGESAQVCEQAITGTLTGSVP